MMPTFRIKGAACLLGVSNDTLRRWADGAATVTVEILQTGWQDR